ncbi:MULTISPECIES: YgfZ/GcvT domain-containing protein [Cryobacterium]|uniref:Folate-binding protein YgfZ n=1 Tax=Cryobacterium zongtaii TaxID=1259217 RepID=A0A2S3ZNR2_9MICO|nr:MULTISPECIES: folate-binding protein YgfZ [Cryobacterium]POH68634.1 folate-binding protein YgfZ [Cryobacterium zongtaii]POH70251.1 folate-binding protein YgfZ [Cryobacterium zongtaii]TFC48514.1 folate-binding protein [Cryobacterium sp. TMN-39-2]
MTTTAEPLAAAAGSPLLELDGAVQADGIDVGVAAHYGSPNTEQRKLLAGTAIVDLSHRGVLSIAGPDRLTWLNSMSSQELRGLTPGQSTETLLLDPAGHLEYAIALIDDGVESWLLVEAAELPGLQAWLDRMRFTLRVQVVDHTLAYATIGTMAADPAALPLGPASPNGVPVVWHDPWSEVAPGGWQYAADTDHPGAAWHWTEVLIPRSALPALRDAIAAGTVQAAGLLALEALRIAAWRPRGALDADERTIPHELDWLRSAVHLNKGCYRGQETVAKVHNLGHPPRRLVLLHLDGSDSVLPAHGDEVQGDRFVANAAPERRTVGAITSSAIHYELGPIALAVIKRTVPGTVTLHVLSQGLSITASQEVIVPESAGSVAEIPRLPRLGVRVPRG